MAENVCFVIRGRGFDSYTGLQETPVAERISTGLLIRGRGFESRSVFQTKGSVMLNLDYDAIREHIEGSHPESVIMIGCDSVRKWSKGKGSALYATVVCIRRASGEGRNIMYHGCKVFATRNMLPDYGQVIRSGKMKNLKMRLMQEVTFALEAFENLHEAIGERPFEIHLDINSRPECESHVALADAKGYVLGMTGREPEFKPFALAASFAADAHAHGVLYN